VRGSGLLRWWTERRDALRCRDAVELMTDYLEGALSPAEDARFEAHLVHCAACVLYLDQMRATVAVLGHLDADQLPDAVIDELVWLYRRHHAG
jgi:anti-sigma factor RsiW